MNSTESSSSVSSDDSGSDYSDSVSDEDDNGDLIEEQVFLETKCLFCDDVSKNPDDCLVHIKVQHDLDIVSKFKTSSYDCIDFIKMVNYVRKHKTEPKDVFADPIPWKVNDEYMKPTIPDDSFLTFDIESVMSVDGGDAMDGVIENGGGGDTSVRNSIDGSGMVIDGANGSRGSLEHKLQESELRIQQLKLTVEKMRSSMKSIMGSTTSVPTNLSSESTSSKLASGLSKSHEETNKKKKLIEFNEKEKRAERKKERRERSKNVCNESYFCSYSHFGIHQEMLSDKVRTESYQKAILGNKDVFKDKVVLDVGCGTGILSMFAASAGAGNVIAVDESDIAFYAMTIVSENNFKNKIEVIKSRLEEITKDITADIIISEWMGYFLVYEGMLDTIIYARDKLLKPNGLICPNRCTMNIAGLENQAFYDKHVTFWDNVYGYSMKSLKFECMSEPLVTNVSKESIITSDGQVACFDIMTCTVDQVKSFSSEFNLKCQRSGTIHAIVGWFMTYFDHPSMSNKVELSTSPFDAPTHWKQTSFFIKEPFIVKEGDSLEGRITVTRPKDSDRALRVELAFKGGLVQEYLLM